jgi:trimethylamine--corrinoid protein Co-methyltransferase
LRTRRERRPDRTRAPFADKPFRRLSNPFLPVQVLTPEQEERIHAASMHILEEIGLEFLDEEALACWAKAGAKVDRSQQRTWIGREFLLETIAHAPREFELRARNPAHSIWVGGNAINFVTMAGMPYFSDLEGGRRTGTLELYQRMLKLAQVCSPIHIIEGVLVEPQDVPIPKRHLEKGFSQLTMTDKVYHTASHGREIAGDYVEMAALVFGGREAIRQKPVFAAVVNVNSPLRYDDRMLGGLITYARAGQCNIVTPFILAGAMSPITLASALAQQNAEALAGIALTQLINPGCPVVYGGFTTSVDMQTGSPSFGNPEGALALFAGAQLARRYGLPYRGSGSLNNAKTPDAQAALETQWTLWPAVMAHANLIVHAAGWLEGGLVCSMEKFILDMEGLAMMHRFLEGVEVSDETLALDSIAEVGSGGHHFGTAHTLARYQDAFYLPFLSDRQNFDTWRENGAEDAVIRANRVAKQLLRDYHPPPMDQAIKEALTEFIEKRKRESTVSYY